MATDTYNPNIPKVKARGSEVQGHPWLYSEFEALLSYWVMGDSVSKREGPLEMHIQ